MSLKDFWTLDLSLIIFNIFIYEPFLIRLYMIDNTMKENFFHK